MKMHILGRIEKPKNLFKDLTFRTYLNYHIRSHTPASIIEKNSNLIEI